MYERKLNFYRINLVIGAITISGLWLVHFFFQSGGYDPLIFRLIISSMAAVLIITSYFVDFVKIHIKFFFLCLVYVIIFWLSFVVYKNNVNPDYVLSQFVWAIVLTSYLESWPEFFSFSLYTVIVSTVPIFLLPDPLISKFLYLFILPSGLLVNSLSLLGKLNLQKVIEQKTKELNKYRVIVQNAGEHMIITDPDGKILYANKAAETTTGYTLTEMLGRRPSLWGGQMPKEFYESMWDTVKNKKQRFRGEIVNKRKNGQLYYAITDIAPVLGEKGEILFFVGIERDITKEKEAQKAIEQRATELSKMNELMVGRELKMVELKKEIAQLKDVASGLAKPS